MTNILGEPVTFDTFTKCLDLVRFWRSRTGKTDDQWPDSRDPDLQALFEETQVVPQDLEKALVALAAWRSAEDGVYQSISCIVHLIRNRENKGMFRTHVTDVEQFPRMVGHLAFNTEPQKEPEFEKVLTNLDDILQGKTVDITQGSIYFGVVGDHMSEWFYNIAHNPDIERTVKLSNTTFYRPKENNGKANGT